jgi:class 3 adenylate cyclase
MKQQLLKYGHFIAIALVLAGLTFYWFSRPAGQRKLESALYQPEQEKLAAILDEIKVFGFASAPQNQQDSLAIALDQYGAANYAEAQQILGDYLAAYPDDKTARFYYGMTQLYLKTPEKALQTLSPLSQLRGFEMRDDASWYAALAASNVDQVRAFGLFSALAKDSDSKYQQAASAVMNSMMENPGQVSFKIESGDAGAGEVLKCSLLITPKPIWWQSDWVRALLAMLFLTGGAGLFFWRSKVKSLEKDNRKLDVEMKRSEALLHNILPAETAQELKQFGHSDTRRHEQVTVLFCDFQGFTNIAEQIGPEELVANLGTCFEAYDRIITALGLEKIKTVGDCYICAGGLTVDGGRLTVDGGAGEDAAQVIRAGQQMLEFLRSFNQRQTELGKPIFHARVGVHTGPVVAGIVGIKKYAYDIWGDTVNIAARMEQACEAGRINISGSTYELVKGEFACLYRGKVEAKGKGAVDMYFVND